MHNNQLKGGNKKERKITFNKQEIVLLIIPPLSTPLMSFVKRSSRKYITLHTLHCYTNTFSVKLYVNLDTTHIQQLTKK